MNAANRSAVPLLSYPGSGNTWTRGLLEKATGRCTGTYWVKGRSSSQRLTSVEEGGREQRVRVLTLYFYRGTIS